MERSSNPNREPRPATQLMLAGAGTGVADCRRAVEPPPRATLQRLAGKAEFVSLLDRQLGQCRRHGTCTSVLMVAVEPEAGGAVGLAPEVLAELLEAVGSRLLSRVRSTDIVARLDEPLFGVVLNEAGRAQAEVVRERLFGALRMPYALHDRQWRLQLRTGVAVYRETGMTGRELADAAEEGLRGDGDPPQRRHLTLQSLTALR